MPSASDILKIARSLACAACVLAAASATRADLVPANEFPAVSSVLEQDSQLAAVLDFSFLPRLQLWQRPGPLTWSSRFEVRNEARWSESNLYMV